MPRICITTECVCDLTDDMLKKLGVDVIYFHIYTHSGCFKDTDEINAENILEYMENGGTTSKSQAPSNNEYLNFFRQKLENCDEIIHIAISSGISNSYKNSCLAAAKMGIGGKNIHIFDSGHLSSGQGLMVIKAAKMNMEGYGVKRILDELEKMKSRVSTSFIVKDAEYLFRNGKVSKGVRDICRLLTLHPVLYMKNGGLALKTVAIGNYDKATIRYVKKQLRKGKGVCHDLLFITHAGCRLKKLAAVKGTAEKYHVFDDIIVNSASAAISSNCGPDSLGVLFVRES